MGYKRPKLFIAIGSLGGYDAFGEVIKGVDAGAARSGALYLVEHVELREPKIRSKLKDMGIDLKEVQEGTLLKEGFYFNPMRRASKGVISETNIAIDKDDDRGVLYFRNFNLVGVPDFFNFNIRKALEAGYGEDMMIAVLSGWGNDGCDVLGKAKDRGSKIIIQDPKSAIRSQMPNNAKQTGNYHYILAPEEIGKEINRFLT